jgi:hypothetical protein
MNLALSKFIQRQSCMTQMQIVASPVLDRVAGFTSDEALHGKLMKPTLQISIEVIPERKASRHYEHCGVLHIPVNPLTFMGRACSGNWRFEGRIGKNFLAQKTSLTSSRGSFYGGILCARFM